jgi:sarcosine oxidase subunit alpha
MTSSRLAAPCGSRIDRSRRLSFQFNGRRLIGHPGDTLASALLASGVQLVGRSFKLHRPRGIFSCGVEEPTGLVDLSEGGTRTPNMRSTLVDLHEGLVAASVNCWPSVRFDLGAVNNRMAALLPAGFYYKTFKWPNWHLYEPSIRRMAGLGRASMEPDPDRYEEESAQADVLVIGGGLAGLSAAVAAAEAGADTLLLASGPVLGGALAWRGDPRIAALVVRAERCGLRQMARTLAFGVYDHNLVCARESFPLAPTRGTLRERLWKIRARAVIAATGAVERPMIFPDNDRPGVMLAGAADKYAHAFGVACGQRVVIAANSDSAYRVAASLRAAGVDIVALVDRRPPGDISGDAGQVRTFVSAAIARVGGSKAVRNCTVVSTDMDGARPEKLDCDLILSAGGFAPAVHLHSQAGGKLRWVEESAMFVPDGAAAGLFSAGACAGIFSGEAAANHAAELGRAVARRGDVPAAPNGGARR